MSQLAKAKLIPIQQDTSAKTIEFMFNPAELSFTGEAEHSEDKGSRTKKKGQNKVSFSNVKAFTITINKIIFDTYEDTGDRNVVKKYIENFKAAVRFIDETKKRPPLYKFQWGESDPYFNCCFVEKLNYKLTMFLPDGTPVRAVIDSLTLKETDEPKPSPNLGPPKPKHNDRQKDSLSNKKAQANKTTANLPAKRNPSNSNIRR